MESFECKYCGSHDFEETAKGLKCAYCGSLYVRNFQTSSHSGDGIAISDDVLRLLQKCRENPSRAKRYASLILDIDPTNTEALKYLRG